MHKNPVISLLFAVALIAGLYIVTRPENDTQTESVAQQQTSEHNAAGIDISVPDDVLALQPNDKLLTEPENAKAVLIEYSDFECPACAAFHPLLIRARQEFGGEVTFAFRHFPLTNIHRNADLAHHVAEAASLQGYFAEVHDALYENQRTWADSEEALETIYTIVEELDIGVDMNQLREDAFVAETEQVIASHVRGGQSVGVNATPTFFLNVEAVERFTTYEELSDTLQQAISEGN